MKLTNEYIEQRLANHADPHEIPLGNHFTLSVYGSSIGAGIDFNDECLYSGSNGSLDIELETVEDLETIIRLFGIEAV